MAKANLDEIETSLAAMAVDSARAAKEKEAEADEYGKKGNKSKKAAGSKSAKDDDEDCDPNMRRAGASAAREEEDEDEDEDDDDDEDEDDKKDDDDEDEPEKRERKGKRAAGADDMKKGKHAGANPIPISASDAAVEISELCMIAGIPAEAATFIRDRKSVEEVRKILADRRSEASMAQSTDPYFGLPSASVDPLLKIHQRASAAASVARKSGMLPSDAYALAVLENHAAYEEHLNIRALAGVSPQLRSRYRSQIGAQFRAMKLGTGAGV